MRLSTARARQAILVNDGVPLDTDHPPDNLALFDEAGNRIDFAGTHGVPPGGEEGQVLSKNSNDDFDFEWSYGGGSHLNDEGYNARGPWAPGATYEKFDYVSDADLYWYLRIDSLEAGQPRPTEEEDLPDEVANNVEGHNQPAKHLNVSGRHAIAAATGVRNEMFYFDLLEGGTVTIVDDDMPDEYLALYTSGEVFIAGNSGTGFGTPLVVSLAAGRYFLSIQDPFSGPDPSFNPHVVLSDGAVFDTGHMWVPIEFEVVSDDPGGGTPTIEDWHTIGDDGEPEFEDTWVNGPAGHPAQFRKLPDGTVHIRGLIAGGAYGVPAFTLPEDYWPIGQNQIWMPAVTNSAGSWVVGVVYVADDGRVVPVTGGADWISLSNANFGT